MLELLENTFRWISSFCNNHYPPALGLSILAAYVLAVGLCCLWLVLVIRRRRGYPLLIVAAVVLVGAATVASDWHHIYLNLAMRNAPGVREDCVRLIQQRHATVKDENSDVRLHGEQLPASFRRLGVKTAVVTAEGDNVMIALTEDTWGSMWGYLYDPKHTYRDIGLRERDIRPTWYPDLYEFYVHGE